MDSMPEDEDLSHWRLEKERKVAQRKALKAQMRHHVRGLDSVIPIIRVFRDLLELWYAVRIALMRGPIVDEVVGEALEAIWKQLNESLLLHISSDFPFLAPLLEVHANPDGNPDCCWNRFEDFERLYYHAREHSSWQESADSVRGVITEAKGEKLFTGEAERRFFMKRPGGWSRATDNLEAIYYPIARLEAAYTDRPRDNATIGGEAQPVTSCEAAEPVSVCPQCHNSTATEDAVLYHELRHPRAFRLFELFPGNLDDPLMGRLCCYNLDDAKNKLVWYEAVSYSWRESDSTRQSRYDRESKSRRLSTVPIDANYQMSCNGHIIDIQANLWYALRRIRWSGGPLILWVDSICIDQANHEEKSQQVALMSSIYSLARRTLIWLGEEWPEQITSSWKPSADTRESAAKIPKTLELLCKLVNSWHGEPVTTYRVGEDFRKADCPTNMPTLEEHEWALLRDLFSAEWFSRRWVIQEVVLSNDCRVLLGECEVFWWVVGFAASLLRTHCFGHMAYRLLTGAHNAYLIFRLGRHGGLDPISIRFLELFRLAAGFDTTDPRDKILALLGIQTADHDPVAAPLILADYNVGEKDLNITFVEALLWTNPPLAFLSGAPSHKSDTPSWLPDWNSRASAQILAPWSLDEQFDAGRGLYFHGRLDETRECLLVSGIQVSSVIFCGSEQHYATEFYIKEVDELADLGLFKPTQQVLALLARTLTAGRTLYGGKEPDPNAMLKHFTALYASEEIRSITKLSSTKDPFISRHGRSLIEAAQQLQEGGDPTVFCNVADLVAAHRILFVTASGHIGLGPDKMKPGHQVCVLAGSPMPVILCREGDCYEFIGECYVDGVMEGEAVEAARQGLPLIGLLGRLESIPILEGYVKAHPSAEDTVRQLSHQTLGSINQHATKLEETEFDIR